MQAVNNIFDEFAEKLIHDHNNRRREKAEEEHRVKDMVDVLLDMAESESQRIDMKITRLHIKAIIMVNEASLGFYWSKLLLSWHSLSSYIALIGVWRT
ncbi:hypothetical protein KI387_027515, partial [Taxus chinensis]